MKEYKQVILVRKDLKLSKGKLGVQSSHASVEATLKSDPNKVSNWQKQGMKKVILKVDDEDELLRYKKLADKSKLVNYLVRDAGKTEIKSGTKTALAIGPDEVTKIDEVSGDLKMM